jgi:hypothetical protein
MYLVSFGCTSYLLAQLVKDNRFQIIVSYRIKLYTITKLTHYSDASQIHHISTLPL